MTKTLRNNKGREEERAALFGEDSKDPSIANGPVRQAQSAGGT
ncbi:hypothetical protein [Noviherbaspirillum pedocola]|nr:hypothetical protein [Noviherbaspirillum pedocola]